MYLSRKVLFLLLLIFVFLGVQFSYSAKKTKVEKTESYKSKKYGFSIEVPATWRFQEINSNNVAVIVVSKDKVKNFYPSMNIRVESAEGLTIESLKKKSEVDIASSKKTLKHIYKYINIVSNKMTSVSGITGFELIIDTITTEGDSLRSISVFFINKGKIYNFVGQAPQAFFKKYGQIFRNVIGSFKFEKSQSWWQF